MLHNPSTPGTIQNHTPGSQRPDSLENTNPISVNQGTAVQAAHSVGGGIIPKNRSQRTQQANISGTSGPLSNSRGNGINDFMIKK